MIDYILRRLLYRLVVLCVAAGITFILMHSVPGGPLDGEGNLPPEIRANKGKDYHWQETMHRLMRNRAALTGGIIIIPLFLTALFADLIAPYSFEKQSLLNANAVPDRVRRKAADRVRATC